MYDFLSKLKLSVGQWLGVVGSAIIGFLLIDLNLKKRKIGQLEVEQMKDHFDKESSRAESELEKLMREREEMDKEYHDSKNDNN